MVVSELSRLGRSLGQIVAMLDALAKAGVAFVALKENIRVEGKRDIQTKEPLAKLFVLTIMERVQERHAGFRSLKEAVDTTTPAGRMMMQMVGAFAEFERAMLKERTKAGLDAARKEGRIGGRPPKLKPHQQQEIVTLVKQGKKTAADAARLFGVHPATVSRLLRRT